MLLGYATRARADEKRTDDGYPQWVVFADVVAATIPLVILATDWGRQSLAAGDASPLALAVAIAPYGPAFLAPIIHGAHGRRDESWISGIGWALTSLVSGGSAILLLSHGCAVDSAMCPPDTGNTIASIVIGASLTGAMITIDAELAHGHRQIARAALFPSVTPTTKGVVVGLGGAF